MVSAGWPFVLHYTKTFVKTIPASDNISVEDVLQVLHPPALAGPNSSVTIKSDDVVDPSKPIVYTRTRTKQEVLAVLNLFTITHTVYTMKGVASWTNDGTDMKFETGRGITISQQWRVKQNEESQEVEILMKFDCRCFFLFRPFALVTASEPYARLLDKVAEKAIAKAKARNSAAKEDTLNE
ncbi:hypothetical protein F5880DRAFT_1291814 [Lentinula raphanica]|nr:hypothetical protein F5880DRAFT_1291814 [Lentinula raphanica]